MIIALTGKMGVGKSEAVRVINEFSRRPVKLVKFAQPLYDMQEQIYRRISSVYQRPESFVKDRFLLQWLGTEWGRGTISETLWTDIWKNEVLKLQEAYGGHVVVICDDCRFDNEADLVKSMGGMVIRIVSNRNAERIDTSRSAHASEQGVSDALVDKVIVNEGTLVDYRSTLDNEFTNLLQKV